MPAAKRALVATALAAVHASEKKTGAALLKEMAHAKKSVHAAVAPVAKKAGRSVAAANNAGAAKAAIDAHADEIAAAVEAAIAEARATARAAGEETLADLDPEDDDSEDGEDDSEDGDESEDDEDDSDDGDDDEDSGASADVAKSYAAFWRSAALTILLSHGITKAMADEPPFRIAPDDPRLARIAVTEAAQAFNSGRSRVVTRLRISRKRRDRHTVHYERVWSAVLDGRTCEECEDLDGESVALDEEFEDEPPLHPNCRCTVEILEVAGSGANAADAIADLAEFRSSLREAIRQSREPKAGAATPTTLSRPSVAARRASKPTSGTPQRILVAGGPRAGKTTLAKQIARRLGIQHCQTDDFVRSRSPRVYYARDVANWLSHPGPWLVEGVTVPRALRVWLRAHPTPEKPADLVVWTNDAKVRRTARQARIAARVEAVWQQVEPELRKRGVTIQSPAQLRFLDGRDLASARKCDPIRLAGGGDSDDDRDDSNSGQQKFPGGTPPKELLIWAYGQVHTKKGSFVFDDEAAQETLKDWKQWGNRITWDYGHDATTPTAPGTQGISAGSCNLELRDDGLWAVDLRWTQKASSEIEDGEWLYFSPTFLDDPHTGRIVSLINIALTNIPATNNMTPLVAASAVPFDGAPIFEGAWDAAAALGRVRKWASKDGSGDPETLDWKKYQKAFAWFDPAKADNIGGYKLPHHDIKDGALVTVSQGVFASAAVLMGARGGVTIPEKDLAGVKAHIAKHYAQLKEDAPWEREETERSMATRTNGQRQLDGGDEGDSMDESEDLKAAKAAYAAASEAITSKQKAAAKAKLAADKAKLDHAAAKKMLEELGGVVPGEDVPVATDEESEDEERESADGSDDGDSGDGSDDGTQMDGDEDSTTQAGAAGMPPPPKTRPNPAVKNKALRSALDAARALTGRSDPTEIAAALKAMAATRNDPTVADVHGEVQSLKTELHRRDVKDRMRAASRAGKLTERLAPQAEKIGMRDGLKALDAFIDALPVLVRTAKNAHAPDEAGVVDALGLEPWERDMCDRFGTDPKKYLAQKKSNAEALQRMSRGGPGYVPTKVG